MGFELSFLKSSPSYHWFTTIGMQAALLYLQQVHFEQLS
jgi:hypothetical protein